ncbi:MAG TPA: hypothetical protein VE958_14230 [Bryobacteraceae bacterium]|jgi:hypothetical protein|nr:hypothetical protein [Bryobacteraceae bacterium]
MKRALGILLCAAALGQSPAPQNASEPDLAALEQAAQKRYAEWESLAKDLSERMARILPCDPRYAAGITEVSRASEARLAALAEYIRGASVKALAETAAAKILLNAEERRAVEAALERADAGQEQTAVDTQSDALAQSIRQRPSLEDAQKVLEQIAAMTRQRAAAAEQQAGSQDAAVVLLRDLVTKFDARDAALRDESVAFEAERGRWNGYYAARLARAQTECSITQVAPSPSKSPARPRGKR